MSLPERADGRGAMGALLAGMAVAILAFAWLFADGAEVGVTWDEPYYFASATRIQDWYGAVISGPDRTAALQRETIREVWDWAHYWNPHPPVYKEAMALTELAFGDAIGSVRGFRLAPLLLFCLLAGAVTWVGAREWGLVAGCTAGVSLILMPRVLGHAHIGATDVPLSCFWFLGSVGAIGFMRQPRLGALLLAGLGFGLALGTKFTGLLLLAPVLGWALVYRRRPGSVAALAAVGVIGVLVFYLANPLAWHDPVAHMGTLIEDSLRREEVVPIATYYLGKSYAFDVPWHHSIVMTLVTVPVGILTLGLWGAGSSLPRLRRAPLAGLCMIEVLFFWALLGLPSSPNHDGVRLFLPMFPFVALLAGAGAAQAWRLLRSRLDAARGSLAAACGAVLFLLPAYLQTVSISPYYLSYYNELIGGVRGAEERGMEMTYWYDAITPAFLDRLNEVLPPEANLATFPSQDYFLALQGLGALRADIRISDTIPSPYYLLYGRRGMFSALDWELYRNVQPLLAVELEGVELAGLYTFESREEVREPGMPRPVAAESD